MQHKGCKWTCCSELPIWQPFSQPGMVLFPRWTQLWTGSPFLSPPQEFTRQQPKIFDRPRSQDNTPGRQFSLKLTMTMITTHDGISDWFVMHFGRFPQDNTPGRAIQPQVNNDDDYDARRYFWLICDALRKVSELSLDWVSRMVFLMHFGYFGKVGIQSTRKPPRNGFSLSFETDKRLIGVWVAAFRQGNW